MQKRRMAPRTCPSAGKPRNYETKAIQKRRMAPHMCPPAGKLRNYETKAMKKAPRAVMPAAPTGEGYSASPERTLEKNFLVSPATTPRRTTRATRFGKAISPLKMSAMVQTAATVR